MTHRRTRRLPALLLASLAVAGSARAASLVTLHSFAATGQGPSVPYAGLVRDGAGNLFGTTYAGGAANRGAVFELSPPIRGQAGWTTRTIHSFGLPGAADGSRPMGALTLDARGVLYGTASVGGRAGGGTVFALAPPAGLAGEWTPTVLADFAAGGGAPVARLLLGADGTLTGTTMAGGEGRGSVFRLTPPAPGQTAWTQTVLYAFTANQPDGDAPLTSLVADARGDLYGTTESTVGAAGRGTIYRLTPPASGHAAWHEDVLFNFPASGAYGSRPDGDLILGTDGALYGTAALGGAHDRGTVFRLRPPDAAGIGWVCSLLTSFTGRTGDATPEGGVVFGPRGTLLGTTAGAVNHQQGTVFELIGGGDARQSWSMQILARFPSRPRGGGLFAVGDLTASPEGAFFGVTESGGSGGGTIFELRP